MTISAVALPPRGTGMNPGANNQLKAPDDGVSGPARCKEDPGRLAFSG